MPLSGMDGLPLVALVQMTLHLCSVCSPTRLSNHVHLKILDFFLFKIGAKQQHILIFCSSSGRGMSKILDLSWVSYTQHPPPQILKSKIFWTDGTMQHSRQLWESKVPWLACLTWWHLRKISPLSTNTNTVHKHSLHKDYTNIHTTAPFFLPLSVYNNIYSSRTPTDINDTLQVFNLKNVICTKQSRIKSFPQPMLIFSSRGAYCA